MLRLPLVDMRLEHQSGLTLMELVVTLALLGILAAIGTPVLLDNIRAAKNADAQNTLRTIYLMQKDYFAKNNCYYVNAGVADNTSSINQVLFNSTDPSSGPITVGVKNDFYFYILPDVSVSGGSCTGIYAIDFVAYAKSKSDSNLLFSINQFNQLTTKSGP